MDSEIRDLKKHISKLNQNLSEYEFLFQSADIPTLIIDKDGTYLDYNAAYVELMGHQNRDDLKKFHPANVSPHKQPDGRDSFEKENELIQIAIHHGSHRFEWMHLPPNGKEFLSDVSLDIIQYRQRDCIRAVIRDISEKTRLERLVAERTKELEEKTKELEIAKNKAEKLSIKDPLTDLYNRRYFSDIAEKNLKSAQRHNHTLSVLMVDIDKFKNTNDTYGHVVGDAVIVMVANKLKELARVSDTVARYGGEEFIALLPETSVENAARLAERIRVGVERLPVQLADKSNIYITVSIGVSKVLNDSDVTVYKAIQRADGNLYKAKTLGRNRVEYK